MNIAIIEQGYGKYLFEVPESISLKEGEKVKCDTKRGVTDGTVWADSVTTDEPTAKLIGKLTGAKFPLKKVVGKMEYQPFEKPTESKPEPKYKVGDKVRVRPDLKAGKTAEGLLVLVNMAEDAGKVATITWAAQESFGDRYTLEGIGNFWDNECLEPYTEPMQEPVKLYCVEGYLPGIWLTKGKAYEVDTTGMVKMDDGYVTTYDSVLLDGKPFTEYFTPLVSRPAKVGEWVYIKEFNGGAVVAGSVWKVTGLGCCGTISLTEDYVASDGKYLVLDGYKPEPEYFSGKVVCVGSTYVSVTVGKAYTVENGIFTWDNGTMSNTKASTIEQFNNWFVAAKFIEFKGE